MSTSKDTTKHNHELQFQAQLLRAVQQAVIATDLNGNVTYWNQFATELYGWTEDEVIGRNIELFTVSEASQAEAKEIMKRLRLGLAWSGRFVVKRKDGSTFLAFISNSPLLDEHGNLEGIVGISTDITQDEQARSALIKARKLLNGVFESLSEVVFVIDSSKRSIILCNPVIKDVFGYSADEIMDKNTEFLHVNHESYQHFGEISEPILERDGVFHTEYQMKHSDGHIITVEITVTLLDHKAGLMAGAVSVVRDITERKQAKEKLQQSEERYRQLFEEAPIAIMEQDFSLMKRYLDQLSASGVTDLRAHFETHPEVIAECVDLARIIEANKMAVKLYGAKSKSDLMQNIIPRIVTLSIKDSQPESLLALAKGQKSFAGEFMNKTLKGKNLELLVKWIVRSEYEDSYERVLVSIIDITARKQAELRLKGTVFLERQSRIYAETLRETAEILVMTSEIEDALQQASMQANDLILFDDIHIYSVEKNNLRLLFKKKLSKSDSSKLIENYQEHPLIYGALTSGKMIHHHETPIERQAAKFLRLSLAWSDWIIIPLISRNITVGLMTVGCKKCIFSAADLHVIKGFSQQLALAIDNSLVHRDLEKSYNDLRDAQSKLIHTARLSAIGEMAAGIAHQINNPLMTVIADSYLLLKHTDVNSPERESSEAISRAAHNAANIVQRLLDFARAAPSKKTKLSIVKTMKGALTLIRPQIESHFINIQLNLADDLPDIVGSNEHLQDVWINLILNARDAVQKTNESILTLSAQFDADQQMVEIIIGDNGSGIPADIIDHVFDPFFTTKIHGTGLGLAICADIIKQHAGLISVQSSSSSGTQFKVLLPTL